MNAPQPAVQFSTTWKNYWLLILLPLALYFPVHSYEFVWDDHSFIEKNRAIRDWSSIPNYFTDVKTYIDPTHWAPMYRPFRNISYLVDYKIAGLKPGWYHIHNLLLHLVNGILVYHLLLVLLLLLSSGNSRTTFAPQAALLSTLVWLVHPLHTESVAWIKSRDELLFSLFYLAGILAMVHGLQHSRFSAGRIIFILFCVAASLLSKEMAVTFPLVAALLLIYSRDRVVRSAFSIPVGALVLVAAFVAVRHFVIGQTQQTGLLADTGYQQFLTMIAAAGRYLQLIVFPVNQLADYQGFPIAKSFSEPRVWLSFTAISALLIMGVATIKSQPMVSFGIAWFFITMFPVSNLIPTMQFLAERFLYLPLIGLLITVSALLNTGANYLTRMNSNHESQSIRYRFPLILTSIMAAIIILLSMGTMSRLPVYKNDLALHERTYKDSPPARRVALNYARVLADSGRLKEAATVMEDLLNSDNPNMMNVTQVGVAEVYGQVLMRLGDTERGLSYTRRALELDPDNTTALSNMAMYYGREGNHEAALEWFEKAVATEPENPRSHQNRGHALVALKRNAEAIEAYETAIKYGADENVLRRRIATLKTVPNEPGE